MENEDEVKTKKDEHQEEIDFYLEYIRTTRKIWNDQELIINQQHAYLGVANEIGALTETYKKVIGEGSSSKIDRTKVLEEIGDISYYVARILDELFYKHEEPFSRVGSKTIFDEVAVELAKILKQEESTVEGEYEIIDLVLALPCYYKDIYLGATNKDAKEFMVGILSLTNNLAEITRMLGVDYKKILIASSEKINKTAKTIGDGTK